MRTTLDIDADVLRAIKEIAAARDSTAGKVLSDLARKGLAGPGPAGSRLRTGFPQLTSGEGPVVTAEDVERLLEDEDREIIESMFVDK